MKGNEDGPVIIAGNVPRGIFGPEVIGLPIDDEAIMPPKGDPIQKSD